MYSIFIALCLSLMTAALFAQPMTVEEAISLGLKNNYDIRIARMSVKIAQKNRGLGTAAFLPVVSANAGAQNSTTDETTNSPFSFGDSESEQLTGQVALSWTLFDGFAMFAEKGRFNALADLGEATARLQIENTVVAILSAYFNLVRQQKLMAVAQNALEVSRDRVEKARIRREIGGASSTDFLNAQVAFNADRAAQLQQEQAVREAVVSLNVLLGRNAREAVQAINELVIPALEGSTEDLVQRALQTSSSIAIAEQNLQIARKNVSSQRAVFLPRLALNASQTFSDQTLTVSDPESGNRDISTERATGAVGLTLNINLFNGFRDNIARQNAKIEQRSTELALESARNRIEGDMRTLLDQFETSLELIGIQLQSVSAAEQNLQLQQERFQLGSASSLEFRDAQTALIQAQTALITARYQARLLHLQIDQLTGKISISANIK